MVDRMPDHACSSCADHLLEGLHLLMCWPLVCVTQVRSKIIVNGRLNADIVGQSVQVSSDKGSEHGVKVLQAAQRNRVASRPAPTPARVPA